ncbi:uncharacterized protein LOC118766574 [Octopus sinensis]|uniref:Uncharacterized protein LOC118766574 n=1 Tax=Octopus sinensis TaxID=2607531 RepID=A0A7E6FDZ4_9MOLL|nr:uncharacterized protein LOC118766574 [Octopus sinensis]XP_036365972.1 uncharacterized protein LOC118766574 [Octopus sinensis]
MNFPFFFVLSLAIFSASIVLANIRTTPNECNKCRTTGHCTLPNCSCCGHTIPGKKSQRPQLVYFSFDDAVTVRNSPLYEELFNKSRTNPNKCPISMTLFVSHNDTDYDLVKQFYDQGMDIAVHGINHIRSLNALQFSYEALGQRLNLANRSQIPKEEIVGFRSPYLIAYGNEQFEILSKAGFAYDSTLTITKRSLIEESPVPFTMDYGWPYPCSIPECPTENIQGFWEVPIVTVLDKLARYPCVYVDGCANSPTNEEESFNFLLENFMSYYTMNKAPFGLNMHSTWLLQEYETNPYRMKAMHRFLDYILGLNDVYVVNIKQIVEWMKHQPSLNELSKFAPFQCQNQTNGYLNGTTISPKQTNNSPNQTTSSINQSSSFPNQTIVSVETISSTKLATTVLMGEITTNVMMSQNMEGNNNNDPSARLQSLQTQQVSNNFVTEGYNFQSTPSQTQPIGNSFNSTRELIHSTLSPSNTASRNKLQNISQTTLTPLNESSVTLRTSYQTSDSVPTNILHKRSLKSNKRDKFEFPEVFSERSAAEENSDIKKTRSLPIQSNSNMNIHNRNENDQSNIDTSRHSLQSVFHRKSNLFRVAASLVMKNDKELEKIITKDSSNHDSAVILVAKNNSIDRQLLTNKDYREPVILIHNRQQKLDYENGLKELNVKPMTTMRNLLKSKITKIRPFEKLEIPSSETVKILSPKKEAILSKKAEILPLERGQYLKTKYSDLRKTFLDFTTGININNRYKNKSVGQRNILTSRYTKSALLPGFVKSREFSSDPLDEHLELSNSSSSNSSPSKSNDDSNVSVSESCQQGKNCYKPGCQCHQFHIPTTSKKIPQFVYFTYEGSINSSITEKLKGLFHAERLNANGCRIKSTLFVTSEGSNYTAIKELYDEGMEIALHGLKKKNLAGNLLNMEIALQKYLLNRYANVSHDKIFGWRNIDLQSKGDVQFENLQNSKMLYDSSLFVMTNLENRTGIWPSTLDFGWKKNCLLQQCPTKKFKGLWEVPAVPYVGIKKRYLCKFVDSCYNKPQTAVQTYDLLLSNFMAFYKRDRTPFGVRLRSDWFLPNNEENLKGLNAFLGLVEELSDVYIVSVKGLIDWMKDPVLPESDNLTASKIGC